MATDVSSPTRQHGTVESGVSVQEHGHPNDDADRMTTPPPFHAGEGLHKVSLI